MNFTDMRTRKQAQDLAPPPQLISDEDLCLLIAEVDEHVMAVWRERFPQDVVTENEFWAQRRAERAARRVDKHA